MSVLLRRRGAGATLAQDNKKAAVTIAIAAFSHAI